METKHQIAELENTLTEAMRTSNIDVLDALIDDELMYTGYDGRLYTKQMDLQAHREKGIEFYSIDASEQEIRIIDDVAIVSVLKNISGSFFGDVQVGIFRFTRIWKMRNGQWKVIAGHATQLVH